jgi:uncharacterized protein YchJ
VELKTDKPHKVYRVGVIGHTGDGTKVRTQCELMKVEENGQTISRITFIRGNMPGRNEPCHCGSGKKFKKCCVGN